MWPTTPDSADGLEELFDLMAAGGSDLATSFHQVVLRLSDEHLHTPATAPKSGTDPVHRGTVACDLWRVPPLWVLGAESVQSTHPMGKRIGQTAHLELDSLATLGLGQFLAEFRVGCVWFVKASSISESREFLLESLPGLKIVCLEPADADELLVAALELEDDRSLSGVTVMDSGVATDDLRPIAIASALGSVDPDDGSATFDDSPNAKIRYVSAVSTERVERGLASFGLPRIAAFLGDDTILDPTASLAISHLYNELASGT